MFTTENIGGTYGNNGGNNIFVTTGNTLPL